jgi:hypothetical protein
MEGTFNGAVQSDRSLDERSVWQPLHEDIDEKESLSLIPLT